MLTNGELPAVITVDFESFYVQTGQPPGSWTDVQVQTSVATLDDFHYRLTFTLPDGSTSTAEVQLVGRSLDRGTMLTGISGGASSGGGTVCLVADPNAIARAVELRVYSGDGLRYVVDTQTIEGVTFAVFHIDGADTPRFDVVDEDGTVEPF
jgi:hypothetical protein